jgi:hypothetical protein
MSGLRNCEMGQDIARGEGSEGSQSRQTVEYGHLSRGTRNQESLYWRDHQQLAYSNHG